MTSRLQDFRTKILIMPHGNPVPGISIITQDPLTAMKIARLIRDSAFNVVSVEVQFVNPTTLLLEVAPDQPVDIWFNLAFAAALLGTNSFINANSRAAHIFDYAQSWVNTTATADFHRFESYFNNYLELYDLALDIFSFRPFQLVVRPDEAIRFYNSKPTHTGIYAISDLLNLGDITLQTCQSYGQRIVVFPTIDPTGAHLMQVLNSGPLTIKLYHPYLNRTDNSWGYIELAPQCSYLCSPADLVISWEYQATGRDKRVVYLGITPHEAEKEITVSFCDEPTFVQ